MKPKCTVLVPREEEGDMDDCTGRDGSANVQHMGRTPLVQYCTGIPGMGGAGIAGRAGAGKMNRMLLYIYIAQDDENFADANRGHT